MTDRVGRLVLLCLTGLFSIPLDTSAEYLIQVGAFSDPQSVERVSGALRSAGFPVTLEPSEPRVTAPLTRVTVGPYSSFKEAQSTRNQLRSMGWSGFVRETDGLKVQPPSAKKDGADIQLAQVRALIPDLPLQDKTEGVEIAQATPSTPVSDPTSTEKKEDKGDALPEASSAWSINGFYQAEVAYTVASPDHWSKLRNTLELGVQRKLSEQLELKVSGRFWYDAVYDVTTFFPSIVRRNQRFEAMFRETYLDVGLGDWDFRFGRQHIIWGEVIGLFFADVVSAKDLRETVLPQFDFLRIPQWAGRVEYFKDDFKAEAVWIPYMTYDEIGKPGSDFYPFALPPPPGFAQKIRRERKPQGIQNSAGGLRLSYLVSGWDLSTFYYTSLDSSPAFFRRVIVIPTPTVFFRPDHDRIHQAGATLSKDLGSFVLKGEAIYTWDRWFNVTRVNDSDGVVRQNFLDYILGLEFPLPMESRLNLQFFQRVFTSHDRDIIPRKVESGATLLVSTKLFNDKVEPELLTIHSFNRLDWLTRFKVTWSFHENWRLVVGTAFFGGPNLGLWGRFDKSDRVFTELRYTF